MKMVKSSWSRKTLTIRKYFVVFHVWLCRMILAFKAEGIKEGEEFKVDWKQVERAVRDKYPGLKLVYSRADPHGGHIAFSQLRIKTDLIDQLVKDKIKVQEK